MDMIMKKNRSGVRHHSGYNVSLQSHCWYFQCFIWWIRIFNCPTLFTFNVFYWWEKYLKVDAKMKSGEFISEIHTWWPFLLFQSKNLNIVTSQMTPAQHKNIMDLADKTVALNWETSTLGLHEQWDEEMSSARTPLPVRLSVRPSASSPHRPPPEPLL